MKNLVQHYRSLARKLNKEALKHYESAEDDDLLLCCLKLRMCLENLSYEKIVPFDKKLNLTELKKWQPRQLIKFLTKELEPYTNQNSTMEWFKTDENGQPIGDPIFIGKERVLSMKEISSYYNKLGSFLHSPTLAQLESGNSNNLEKLKNTCNELIKVVEEVLSSTIYSSPLMETHSINCHRCQEEVICYVPLGSLPKSLEVTCAKCHLEIEVIVDLDGNSKFTPKLVTGNCNCGNELRIYSSDLKEGAVLNCSACDSKFIYATRFYKVE